MSAANWASYSQLSTHRACPQKWHYSALRRLQKIDPEDVKVEMEFGSWWHMLRAADALARGRRLGSLQQIPENLTCVDDGPSLPAEDAHPEQVHALAEVWWKTLTPLTQDTWVARLGEGLVPRLRTLDARWRAMWAEEIRTEHPLSVEMRWKRELPSGSDTVLIGYVDEVYWDARRNMVVVRDDKTSKALSTQSTADDMMDSQLQLYAWGASPVVTAWGKGTIQATAYDRVRTTKPKTPEVTQSGTLAKKITDFDVDAYREWAAGPDGQGVPFPGRAKDGSGAGLYQVEPAVVENLSSPKARSVWFQRTLSPLNRNIVRSHLRAAVDSSLDMAKTRVRVEETHEAGRNLTDRCRWCDYAGLCRAEMVGGPDGDYNLSDFKLRVRSKR